MASTQETDLKDILEFVNESRGWFLTDLCEIKPSPIGGLCIFAKQKIPTDTTLLRLHKSCIFSSSNSSIANLLLDSEVDGLLALNIAFIYEITVFKDRSHWVPYLKSIRVCNSDGSLMLPPAYWGSAARELLRYTTVDTLYDGLRPQEEIREGYEVARGLAKRWNREFGLEIPTEYLDCEGDREETFLKFVAVAFAISSRVFEIDAFHKSALVPIADLFNHHVDTPDIRFVSLYDVCDLCGEAGECKHVQMEELGLVQRLSANKKGIEEEQQESLNGEISYELIRDLEREQQLQREEEGEEEEGKSDGGEDGGEDLLDPEECVEMVSVHDIRAGEEIFNSYGELSNSLLLMRYGFAAPENPWDVVDLGRDVLRLVRKTKQYTKRAKWWSTIGYDMYSNWVHQFRATSDEEEDDDDDDDDEDENGSLDGYDSDRQGKLYTQSEGEGEDSGPWLSGLELDCNGEASPSMWALLNILSMKEPEWKKFLRKVTEDADSSTKVEGLLLRLEQRNNPNAKKLLLDLINGKRLPRLPEKLDSKKLGIGRNLVDSVVTLIRGELSIISRARKSLS